MQYTDEQIAEMRAWLLDCDWADDDAEIMILEASTATILTAVARHYDGGIAQFICEETCSEDCDEHSPTICNSGAHDATIGDLDLTDEQWRDLERNGYAYV